ncbi:hypothetical protein ACGFRB_21290 [Streptomyces sp. NPDC048718]|uniref:hypothetical protein n=1 Tax=Streptomyces sp. NPDC048718 TaxID=3365587 RepID=UPI00370FCECE
MRRAALVCAGAALALAAVAVGSAEQAALAEGDTGAPPLPDLPDLPDLRGKGLWRVFTTLDARTCLDVHDAAGSDRRVLWPLNWRVCTQYPPPGTARHSGGRLVIGVLKKGEPCPARVAAARR